MNNIDLTFTDIEKLYTTAKLLKEQYEADFFTIERENHSGIGYTLDMTFYHKIPELGMVETTVPIVDEKDW